MGHEYGILGMAGTGFFGMLLIGFLAGWIAERTMNRDHGVLTNILVGIAGSFVGGTAAGLLGFQWYGFLGNLVVATLGAIAILWFFGKREHPAVVRGDSRTRGGGAYREAAEPGRASDRPEETGSDLPPIYHATTETASARKAENPSAKKSSSAKSTSNKPAAKRTTKRKK